MQKKERTQIGLSELEKSPELEGKKSVYEKKEAEKDKSERRREVRMQLALKDRF